MFGQVVPPQVDWSRPSSGYDVDAFIHIPSSLLLNHFFLPSQFRGDDASGGFVEPNRPGALTELSSLVTLQTDSTICAGSDLPQLPPEEAWGSQPADEFVDDAPFIPPSASNRSYSPPVASTTQPEYSATQQTTTQFPNFNIDPRLYQVRVCHTPSSAIDSSQLSRHSPQAPTPVITAEVQLHLTIAMRVAANEAMDPTEAPRQVLNPALRVIPSTVGLTTINFHQTRRYRHPFLRQPIILHTTTITNVSDWNTQEETR